MAKKANSSAIKSVSVTKKEKEQPQKKSGATQIKSVSSSWSPSQTDLGNINKLTQLLQGMTDEQHTVLRAAVANNQDIVVKGRTARPEDSAYYQYAQAIRELTDEDGTVNYDPDGYRFNPYSEGLPDETARKAYESLSYKDQLMLEIGKNGKPKTPDFGDPSVDTGVYDRYQQALQRVEADEKAAAEAEKIRVKQEADDAATKAVEELYKANRGDWNYDPKADVKAIKESNKDITLTQTELKEIFEGLQSQYDWDDEAYAKWTSNGRVVDTGARTTSSHDPSKNTVAAMNSAEIAQAQADMETYLRARNNTAFMKAFNKLTGKDTIEYYLKKNRRDADGSFADDAKYVVNQAVQGIGDFVGGAATLAGLATKAQIDTALAPAWFITNEGKRWTMEEAREMFGSLDTIMSIAETSGSAAGNAYNQSGVEKASGTAKFIGGLARAFTSSMTSGIAGSMLASAAPALTSTVDVSAKLGDKAPTAVKALAKLVPEIKVGVNQLPFLTQAFGSGYQEAKIEGYNEAGALVWGGWTALAEGIPESISWNWSSATGSSIKSKVYGGLNQGAAKNATKKGLKNLMTKIGDAGAMKILAAMNAEGMEEVMTNYLEWFGRETILKQDVDLPTLRENLTAYASGALLSAITQGFSYATTTPARKQAETIVDGMMNGQSPTAEQVQALDDANNEEAAKLPLSNEQLETAVGNGLHVDEKIVTAYRTVNNELTTAEKRATDALHNLQQMNANGVPFGDPTRVAAVKAFTDARKDIVALTSKRAATHAKYLGALDGMIQDTEAALAEVEAAQQQAQQEYAQWQVDEMLATDPQGLMTATQELQSAVNEELVTLKAELKQNGMRMDIGTRTAMMQRVNALGESAVKLQQMADAAYAAIVPTIAEQPTSENDGANTPPENGTPVQAVTAEGGGENTGSLIATHSLSIENAIHAVKKGGLPSPSFAITSDKVTVPENYGEVTFVVGADSIDPEVDARNKVYNGDAWTLMHPTTVERDGVEYVLSNTTDEMLPATPENIARVMYEQESTLNPRVYTTESIRSELMPQFESIREMYDSAELLQPSYDLTSADNELGMKYLYNAAENIVGEWVIANAPNGVSRFERSKVGGKARDAVFAIAKERDLSDSAIRRIISHHMNIEPSEQLVKEVGEALAFVRNIRPNYFEAKPRRAVTLDEVKLALLPQGEKANALEQALQGKGVQVVRYGGTFGARDEVLRKNAGHLLLPNSKTKAPSASKDVTPLQIALTQVPDFRDRSARYGKGAAGKWVKQAKLLKCTDEEIVAHAADKKLTSSRAKERAFWANVESNIVGEEKESGKKKVMAFKPTPQQETQGDVVKVLDETSPYMQADSTDMKHASSTYPTVRKLASIKNDIQNTLGFRYSDEHFVRAQRKAGAVAYYEPTGRFVVSDDTNNLPAFLHEAGHHMALDQYNEDEVNAFKQNVPRKFLDEYPEGAQVQEAGAEMFRAWMMDPEFMERNYPETFDAMRNALGKGKYNRLRDESAAVRKWMDADVEKRVSSTQVTIREQEKARKKNFAWSDSIKKEADVEYGYKKLDRIMQRNGVTLAASADARAACARTSSEAIHALMFDGMYDPKTGQKIAGALTETTRGLIVTAEDKQTLEVYLELKQSLDRYEKNNKDWTFSKNVCTPAEAKAYVESVENNKKNVVDAAKNLWKWLEKYRHTQLSGAIPQSVIDEWDTLNPHYIPQTRVFTDNVRAAVRGSKTGDGTGVNRRKVGSTRDFLSPIDAIVQMVAKTKTAAMKHETLLALQEYYDAGEAYAGDFLHEVEPGVHITPVDGLTVTKAAVNALERGGMDAETLQQVNDLLDGNSPETRVYRYGAPNGRNNNIVAITQDGHTRYFEVRDQDLMDAIAPMNRQQLGSFLTAVSKMNRQISALITSQNPLFAGSNAIRDFVTGYAFGSTKNPIKYVGDYVSAARDVAKNTDAARQYRAMGGGGGLAQSLANADQVNDVTEAMFGRAGDDRNTVKRALDTVGNKLDEFNGGIETIPRLAEYKRQLENGASYAEAIKAAKNLTTDFSTSGTHSKIMNTLWRFYGAQVNGLYKTFNLFADKNNTEQTKKDFNKTIGAISGIAVAGALWHFALHLLDDEDEYAALPDYIKDDYYIIPYGGGKFVRIPKPNDPLLVALDSMGRNLADTALRIQADDDAGDVVKDEGIDLLGDIASILLPFGDWNKSNPLGSNFVGAPVMQWAYNKTWTGADIVPSYMEDVSPALQYDDKTSWVSRQFGKAFNISPMKLDNLFDQSSGVIGEVVDAFSAGVDAARQGGIVEGVGAGLKEALLSRFLVDSAYSQNVTGGFYDAKDELTQFIEDVERNIDIENLPYSPIMKNLGPSETNAAYKEAKNMAKKINELSKKLSDIGKQAAQYTQQGNEEKAREMKYKQQELAAEASLVIADFFDKWKNQ